MCDLLSGTPFWVTIDFPKSVPWALRVERAFKMLCSWKEPTREERLYGRTWMRGLMAGSTPQGVEHRVREECVDAGAEEIVITVSPVWKGKEIEDVPDVEGRPEGWAKQAAAQQEAA